MDTTFFLKLPKVSIDELRSKWLEDHKIKLFVKREDQIDAEVSGNKFRKLKYNFLKAEESHASKIISFGGAYSNHIAALAKAGKLCKISTLGIIRGEELEKNLGKTFSKNSTLRKASQNGMQLRFINREQYRLKDSKDFIRKLEDEFPGAYIIPEGGTNKLAIKGCQEIIQNLNVETDVICCPIGTGGTISGLINGSGSHQEVLGFASLKGNFLTSEIEKWVDKTNWELNNSYHFEGYGKVNQDLIEFMNDFYKQYQILLDPVYTAKMFYGIFDLIRLGYFPKNTRILAIHTGGLQGISAMNQKLANKNLPLISTQLP